jgi:hypothetical protein
MLKQITGKVSVDTILGTTKKVAELSSKCVICNKNIPVERIKALKSLGTPSNRWTHTACSTVGKVKGLYLGEVGTSQLQLCDKVYNDSVRSVFRRAEVDSGEEPNESEKE